MIDEIVGKCAFNITVRLDTKEMADWEVDRINAFFSGLAEALGAISSSEAQDLETLFKSTTVEKALDVELDT